MKQLEVDLDKVYRPETIYKSAFSKPKSEFLSGLEMYEILEVKESIQGSGDFSRHWRKKT